MMEYSRSLRFQGAAQGSAHRIFDDALPYSDTHFEPSLATRRVFLPSLPRYLRAPKGCRSIDDQSSPNPSDSFSELEAKPVTIDQGSNRLGRTLRVQRKVRGAQNRPRGITAEVRDERLQDGYHRERLERLADC